MKAHHQKELLHSNSPLNMFFTDVSEFPPHWHEVAEMIYVPEGSLRVGVNNEIYKLEPRDILLITDGDVHYFVPETERINRLILHFSMSFFESAFPTAKNKRFTRIIWKESEAGIHHLLEEQITAIIDEYSAQKDACEIAMRARLLDILVLLARNVPMQPYSPQKRNRRLNRLERLENVFTYVENNYCSDISLEEISSVANFSEYYFTRFFKEATGMTFGSYLSNYRVEKAAQLLRDTNDTITEVVFKSGFGSIKNFNRVFKQIKGCPPSIYKKTISEE